MRLHQSFHATSDRRWPQHLRTRSWRPRRWRKHRHTVHSRRGRILAIKWGLNPNSSSLGVDVTFLLFGAAALSLATPVVAALMRLRRPHAAGAPQTYGETHGEPNRDPDREPDREPDRDPNRDTP